MAPGVSRRLLLPPLLALVLWIPADAADWPQFLGPERDGTYPGDDVVSSFPAGGPKTLWRKAVGEGFSGPVVAGDRLILFHRIEDREVVECLDTESGERRWKHAYATSYDDRFGFDEGPRATPAIAGGSVYTFGAQGVLSSIDLASGKPRWTVDTHSKLDASEGFFGAAVSPLVEGGKVLLGVGGKGGAGIVAFDAESGEIAWKATDHDAGYASPVAATIDGRRHAFFFTREGLVDVDPGSGRVRFEVPWRARIAASVNAATPLVVEDRVLVTASYRTGALLLEVRGDTYEEIWSGERILSSHYVTPVHHEGHVYGIDGRQEYGGRLRSIELRSGKVRWNEDGFGTAHLLLLRAVDRLLLLHEDGRLLLARASPDGYAPLGEARVLREDRAARGDDEVRAPPALAAGRLYARDTKTLVCVDLRPKP